MISAKTYQLRWCPRCGHPGDTSLWLVDHLYKANADDDGLPPSSHTATKDFKITRCPECHEIFKADDVFDETPDYDGYESDMVNIDEDDD